MMMMVMMMIMMMMLIMTMMVMMTFLSMMMTMMRIVCWSYVLLLGWLAERCNDGHDLVDVPVYPEQAGTSQGGDLGTVRAAGPLRGGVVIFIGFLHVVAMPDVRRR